LSDIIDEINRAGKEQQEKEIEVVEKIRLEAEKKAEILQEKKNLEAKRILDEEKSVKYEKTYTLNKEQVKELEEKNKIKEPQIFEEPKPKISKLFYGILEFDGITIDQAKMFSKFLKENNIAYTPVKQEVR
jgi:hypothetical protein